MKILQVISSANPDGGGPVEVIRQFGPVLAAAGHRVELACLDPPQAPWLADFPIVAHGLGPAKTSYAYAERFVPWLRDRRREYDAVVVNGLWQYSGFGTHRALAGTDTPYFVFCHGMLDPWFNRFVLKRLKKQLYWPWGEYRVLRDARKVLFTCEEEQRLARRSFWPYRCTPAVVPLGIRQEAGEPERFWEAFAQLAGARIILFLGRIHPKKGCDLLIEAFAKVASQDAALQLVFAGPDQVGWWETLRQQAERAGVAKRVHALGPLRGPLKWAALAAAEVFVLPSHQENFGIAVVEALACGTPVLISTQVNIWREVIADAAGLAEADTPAGTLALLQSWLALSAQQRQTMASRARNCFERRFAVESAARVFLETLQT